MGARCAVVGSGNIGSDLLIKMTRSSVLEPRMLVGIDPASDGLRRVRFSMPRRITVASAEGQSAARMRSAAVARAATIPCTRSGS